MSSSDSSGKSDNGLVESIARIHVVQYMATQFFDQNDESTTAMAKNEFQNEDAKWIMTQGSSC